MEKNYIKIENIDVWARVGILKQEQRLGQLFSLDVFLYADFDNCLDQDDINQTIDYVEVIELIRSHSKKFKCLTIEKYSVVLINLLKRSFDIDGIKIVIKKCKPPIIGFNGSVSITRVYEKGIN